MNNIEVVSKIPGRLRVKTKKLSYSQINELCKKIIDLKYVKNVRSNIYTSKLLILYNNEKLSTESIMNCMLDVLKDFKFKIVQNKESRKILEFDKKLKTVSYFLAISIFLFTRRLSILISVLFINYFSSIKKVEPKFIKSATYNLAKRNILVKRKNSLKKLAEVDIIIFNIESKKLKIKQDTVERLRENGIPDIRIISSKSKNYIEEIAYDAGIENYKYNLSYSDKKLEIKKLHNIEKKVAIILDRFEENNTILGGDILIFINRDLDMYKLQKLDYDLIIISNHLDYLVETIVFSKYIIEKIGRGQLISIWTNLVSLILSARNILDPIKIWMIMYVNKLYINKNSRKILEYES